MYMLLKSGVSIFLAPLSEGRTIAFIGDRDAQPNLNRYHLYLRRIRVETRGSSYVTQAAGECVAEVPSRLFDVKKLNCEAEDENGQRYSLKFAAIK